MGLTKVCGVCKRDLPYTVFHKQNGKPRWACAGCETARYRGRKFCIRCGGHRKFTGDFCNKCVLQMKSAYERG